MSINDTKVARHKRPAWVPKSALTEEFLCVDCFRVVGVKSRYHLVLLLGKNPQGLTVTEMTDALGLKQPTVTHHLNALKSAKAVTVEDRGRERVYKLDRSAHCFEECKIPFK